MILPTKHISAQYSLLGAGAAILRKLDSPQTVTGLWERVRVEPEVGVYWRFVLALDFLFSIRAVELKDGLVSRLYT
ncbi:MAG: ABC-three component system middle component 6 [Desulfomonilaceae bacterium]